MNFKFIAVIFLIFCSIQIIAQNCGLTLSVPVDITICEPQNIVLDGSIAGSYFSYEWSGTDGYRNTSDLKPTVYVQQSTTFTLKAFTLPSTNVIVNGDFSGGASGFTTDYQYVQDIPGVQNEMGPEGTYTVINNPNLVHNGFDPCSDHTGGGDMMVVNGAASFQKVWCQTVTINPNHNYIFNAFATSVNPASPAILQFSINGVLLGSPFRLSGSTCLWEEFYAIWNSGGNTTVEICITNQNTAQGGNDFAIDDIFFGEICETKKDFTVNYSNFFLSPPSSPTLNCSRPTANLSASPFPSQFNYNYLWETQDGKIQSGNKIPVITVSAPGTYNVTVTNHLGCTKTQSYEVIGNFEYPVLDITGQTNLDCITKKTILVAASSMPGTTYSWVLPNNLRVNGNSITATQPGIYTLSGTGTNSCTSIKTIEITRLNNQFKYQVDSSGVLTCKDQNVSIHITNQSAIDSIRWTGPGIIGLNPDQDTIVVAKPGTYLFFMYIGPDCIHSDSITIHEVPPVFAYQISEIDTLNCTKKAVDILLTNQDNIADVVWWYNGQSIGQGTPFTTNAAGRYFAVITDINGCTKTDSVEVLSDLMIPDATVKIDSINCVDMLGGFNITTDTDMYVWEGNGQTSREQNPKFAQSGIYKLTLTGRNGCKRELLVELPSAVRFPKVTAIDDKITCVNPVAKINLQSDIPALYSWTGASGIAGTGPLIVSAKSDIFTIEATSLQGCKTLATASVFADTIRPQLNLSIADVLTCIRSQVKPIVIASGYQQITWSGPNFMENTVLVPSFDKPGLYSLTLKGANGCEIQKNITITEDRKKPFFLATVKDIDCAHPDTKIQFSGDINNNYSLQKGGNFIPITSDYIINLPGKYLIKATNNAGCDSLLEVSVQGYFEKPKVKLPSVKLNCLNPSGKIFNVINDGFITYIWHTAKGPIEADTLLVNSPGMVSLYTINSHGCEKRDTVVIESDFTKPDFIIPDKEVIRCHHTSAKLNAQFGPGNFTYYWSGNNINDTPNKDVEVTKAGSYSFYMHNNDNGCSDIKSTIVDLQPSPDNFIPDIIQPKCFGDKGYLYVNKIYGGTPPYIMTIDKLAAIVNNKNIVNSGIHQIEITDHNGCSLFNEIRIDTVYAFKAYAGKDVTMPLYESYTLQGSTSLKDADIKSVQWSPSITMSCDHCLQTIVSPEIDTKYILTISNQNGCVESDSVAIRVIFDKGFVAPNIFAPYSGSQNNRFTIYPHRRSIDKILSMQIYDRWGNLVFIQKDFEAGISELGWDGNFGSSGVQTGVFVWVAEILYKDGSKEPATGDITLIR